jgi:hypothetical protein
MSSLKLSNGTTISGCGHAVELLHSNQARRAAAARPEFSGDINGLNGRQPCVRRPFLLASHACILYPVGLPRIRAAPAVFSLGVRA